jgi:hypothetical protein
MLLLNLEPFSGIILRCRGGVLRLLRETLGLNEVTAIIADP